jgi:hypothetical protein
VLLVPWVYCGCNLLRHVDAPATSFIAAISIGFRTFTPFALAAELQQLFAATPPGAAQPALFWSALTPVGLPWALQSATSWTSWLGLPAVGYIVWTAGLILWTRRRAASGRHLQAADAIAAIRRGLVVEAEDEAVCRICWCGVDDGALLSPCLCRGGMRYVHPACLNDWRTSSANPDSLHRCDTCKFVYSLRRTRLATLARSAMAMHCLALLLLLGCVVLAAHAAQLLDLLLLDGALASWCIADKELLQLLQLLRVSRWLTAAGCAPWFLLGDAAYLSVGAHLVGLVGFVSLGLFGPIFFGGGQARSLATSTQRTRPPTKPTHSVRSLADGWGPG